MLINSGWDYEKGLGAEGQGARHPVATRLKHDRLALGAAGTSRKLVTHTFEEIEKSRTKPTAKVTDPDQQCLMRFNYVAVNDC